MRVCRPTILVRNGRSRFTSYLPMTTGLLNSRLNLRLLVSNRLGRLNDLSHTIG